MHAFFNSFLTLAGIACGTIIPSSLLAQVPHSDVEFGYDSVNNPTVFVIEQPNRTTEGFQYFESAFEALDPFAPADLSSDEPGFATNAAENLSLIAGHQIWVNTLNAASHSAFGQGYINYFNPLTNSIEAAGSVSIIDNSSVTPNLTLEGAGVISGVNPQFLSLVDSNGDIHDHLTFDLLNEATSPVGAYGMLLQLQADFNSDGIFDLTSDPYWLIFNHGMTESEFDARALRAFGVAAIPEPSSIVVVAALIVVAGRRKRRPRMFLGGDRF